MPRLRVSLLPALILSQVISSGGSFQRNDSKEARLSEEQALILKRAADLLLDRAQKTSMGLTLLQEYSLVSRTDYLRTSVANTLEDIEQLKTKFKAALTDENQRATADRFFSDVMAHYQSDEPKGIDDNEKYQFAVNSTFQSLSYNYKALLTVADAKSLTFDLQITSVPQEGTISLKRKGDDYQTCSNRTNATVQNLTYAQWYVRVHVDGYEDQEQMHDPFREPNHVLQFVLKPKPKV